MTQYIYASPTNFVENDGKEWKKIMKKTTIPKKMNIELKKD
jgi:hypothetical protein